jgi:TM2 domain-containing membrane protein YozV
MEKSDKKKLPALLFCLLLGYCGAHRFYVGKNGTAILQFFTAGGLLFWAIVDAVMIITGNFTDSQGRELKDWK